MEGSGAVHTFGPKTRWRQWAVAALGIGYCVGAFWLATIVFYCQTRPSDVAPPAISSGRRPFDLHLPTVMSPGHAEHGTQPLGRALVAPADVATELPVVPASPAELTVAITDLRARRLRVPVQGVATEALTSSFEHTRNTRRHEALDILAPRGTPVLAVEDGEIAKLFISKRGGLTIYQFDPSERYAYYYAHLDRYAEDLEDGDDVDRGEVIGYVGTTGNAPRGTPHLHFAIFKLGPAKRWWEGAAIDPFLVWQR